MVVNQGKRLCEKDRLSMGQPPKALERDNRRGRYNGLGKPLFGSPIYKIFGGFHCGTLIRVPIRNPDVKVTGFHCGTLMGGVRPYLDRVNV
jgi:hypothetical protein